MARLGQDNRNRMFWKNRSEKKTLPLDYFPRIRRTEFETRDNLKRYFRKPFDRNINKGVSRLKSLYIYASSMDSHRDSGHVCHLTFISDESEKNFRFGNDTEPT